MSPAGVYPVGVYVAGTAAALLGVAAPAFAPHLLPVAWSGGRMALVLGALGGVAVHALAHLVVPAERALTPARAAAALCVPGASVAGGALAVTALAPELAAVAYAAFVANLPGTIADAWEAARALSATSDPGAAGRP